MAKLQKLIDKTAEAHAKFYANQKELTNYCIDTYGYDASDVDADWIIDGVFGGCGAAVGCTAERFDREMRESYERNGLSN
jgi:hypothetical protein